MLDLKIKKIKGPDKCTICQLRKRAAILNCLNSSKKCQLPQGVKCAFDDEIREALDEQKERKDKISFTVVSRKTVNKHTFKVGETIKKESFKIQENEKKELSKKDDFGKKNS